MNLKNKKIIFIVNPNSGKLSTKNKIKIISRCLPTNPDIIFPKTPDETSHLSAQAFKKKHIVVACGGDGTVNLVANQAIIHDGTMSILPFGRGNDFAKFIGINDDKQFIDMLEKPSIYKSEYLELFFKNSYKICLTSVGVGLLSEAAYRASKIPLLQGSLLYTIAALSCFINLKSHSYIVNFNKKIELNEKLTILVVASTPFAGGGMHIAPEAQKIKNKINLLYAKKVSRIEAIGLLSKVMSGNHLGHQKVNNSHIKQCKITTKETDFWAPLVYGDGEYIGNLPVEIKKGKKYLKLLVPNNQTIG
ncbi:MAG: diacylglycerol/lipid kinase family protein [Paracoccaceae bacterium]